MLEDVFVCFLDFHLIVLVTAQQPHTFFQFYVLFF